MTKMTHLKHQFVEEIPDEMESGELYITLSFDTMAHLCACGCGQEIVTPISPTDWSFTYNGRAISIHPSIGNWSHACRSHYVVRSGRIVWAGDWSEEQVEAGRARDRIAKARQFEGTLEPTPQRMPEAPSPPRLGWLKRMRHFIGKKD